MIDGGNSVYLDRFFNQPSKPDGTARPTRAIRADLLDTFDETDRVIEAGRLVAEHFRSGGHVADLQATIAQGSPREDPQFPALQNVEAAFRRVERTKTVADRRLPLIATVRYLTAHFPAQRASEQTTSPRVGSSDARQSTSIGGV